MKRLIIVLLLISCLYGQDSTERMMHLAVAGQVIDLVSTEIALMNGYTELNPLMQDQSVRIVSKAVVSILFYMYAKKYPKEKGVALFAIVSWIPVGHNFVRAIR